MRDIVLLALFIVVKPSESNKYFLDFNFFCSNVEMAIDFCSTDYCLSCSTKYLRYEEKIEYLKLG